MTPQQKVSLVKAVQDTYTLLRKGMRKLLRELGYHLPGQRRGLSENTRKLVETYVDQDRKADIDWRDSEARAEHLKALVDDVKATVTLATKCHRPSGNLADDKMVHFSTPSDICIVSS